MAKRKTSLASKKKLADRVQVRLSDAEKSAYQEAAARQGISLSNWLRFAARMVIRHHDGKVELGQLDD